MIVLVIFHRRRTRNDEKEWGKDPQELDDYGLGGGTDFRSKGAVKAPTPAHKPERPANSAKNYDEPVDELPHTGQVPVNTPQGLAAQLRQRDKDDIYAPAPVPRSMV